MAITLGDPAGVGPEIVVRLFKEGNLLPGVAPFVVGEARHLEQAARLVGGGVRIRQSRTAPDSPTQDGTIVVVEPTDFVFQGPLDVGKVSPACGAAAWAYIRRAVGLVQTGEAEAIATAPIHKEALHAAGCPHPGHTEMLAELAGGSRVAMLLVGGGVRVALATIHEPIARVPSLLSLEKILDLLRLMNRFIPWFGIDRPGGPRIAVTGLNPHAGEGGMFGDEEERIIAPAVKRAQSEGIDAEGPVPADTIFFFHRQGACDAVLAMFHDQALIPVKTLDFHAGVNVTMGLPFIRTSVDHGTAFNIAGRGMANAGSLRAAVECAALLTRNRLAQSVASG
ncbi:4-hydroxythreonine-4-phosphate dehydrogenase PdxA [Candidatus Sumerlaeota bacterium]|nr:4-hydroxythreonine-4-phosphate dehydrogenase PdxA [Candidatus Sumerlaeota bacterium]